MVDCSGIFFFFAKSAKYLKCERLDQCYLPSSLGCFFPIDVSGRFKNKRDKHQFHQRPFIQQANDADAGNFTGSILRFKSKGLHISWEYPKKFVLNMLPDIQDVSKKMKSIEITQKNVRIWMPKCSFWTHECIYVWHEHFQGWWTMRFACTQRW